MSRRWIVSVVIVAAIAAQAVCAQGEPAANAPAKRMRGAQAQGPDQKVAAQALGSMAALFVENKGQWDPKIRFAATGRAVSVALTDSSIVYQLSRPKADAEKPGIDSTAARRRRLRAESTDVAFERLAFTQVFEGANPTEPKGIEEAKGKVRYYTGKDPSGSQSNVSTFKGAEYKGLYEGVDLVVRPGGWGVRCEFHAAPKAPVDKIVMKYDGVTGMKLDDAGRLHVNTAFGELVYEAPTAWQESGGQRNNVLVKFRLTGEESCGFELSGHLDETLPLVIGL